MASTANPVFAKATANLAVENQKDVETSSISGRPSILGDADKARVWEIRGAKVSRDPDRQSMGQIEARA